MVTIPLMPCWPNCTSKKKLTQLLHHFYGFPIRILRLKGTALTGWNRWSTQTRGLCKTNGLGYWNAMFLLWWRRLVSLLVWRVVTVERRRLCCVGGLRIVGFVALRWTHGRGVYKTRCACVPRSDLHWWVGHKPGLDVCRDCFLFLERNEELWT